MCRNYNIITSIISSIQNILQMLANKCIISFKHVSNVYKKIKTFFPIGIIL
ncbi:hypothetical protein HanXRQr2_Chr16g0746521 [Helianthus annuus]|uniref:Uncharacterized protein n=1 Tax=Helianthus annuus TaxID=4232 RepID=A0A9K3GY15_HELAN|nr:hypothetical protein HanXRQr2_Chr16g0746521 [Helianthus annuus]